MLGYRFELPPERLEATFGADSRLSLSTQDVPTRTENAPIVGESTVHDLADLAGHRLQEVDFLLAREVLQRFFADDEGHLKPWLFPSLLRIARTWREQCLHCKDHTFPQLLLMVDLAARAAEKIYTSIVAARSEGATLKPILRPYDTLGSTCHLAFDTARPVWATAPEKCHVNFVVADTDSWEQKLAQTLEELPAVLRYVKNYNLGFTIPYVDAGRERAYVPDFVAHLDDGHGGDDPLQLIIEVTGQKRAEKEAKVAAARNLWVPAVNNHGGYGRWAFVEINDPWDARAAILGALAGGAS